MIKLKDVTPKNQEEFLQDIMQGYMLSAAEQKVPFNLMLPALYFEMKILWEDCPAKAFVLERVNSVIEEGLNNVKTHKQEYFNGNEVVNRSIIQIAK